MTLVWTHILAAIEAGDKAALISVIQVAGSTPREVGARIVLNGAGGFNGTIGGGNMENASLNKAQKMLSNNSPMLDQQKHLLGPDMGQCCGGAVSILTEIFTIERLAEVEILAKAETKGEFSTTGRIELDMVSRKIMDAGSALGLQKTGELAEAFGLLAQPIFLFGAGHVGKALMLHLASLPFQINWVDSRKGEFPSAVPANFELICLNQPHKILAQAPDNAQILILTHDHDVDFEIVSTALQMQRFAYVGMIGSKTKKARFVSRFKKLGLSSTQIESLVCPIGLLDENGTPKIKSKKPQSIAVSIVADLLTRVEI